MKKIICAILSVALMSTAVLGLSACSGKAEVNEENILYAVEQADAALKDFDTENLNKFVDSSTLGVIIPFAEKKEAFRTLGKAMFKNLKMEVKSVDVENKTVTLEVINKDLALDAADFAYNLKYNYSTTQLLGMLDNDDFINKNLNPLIEKIDAAKMQSESTEITLKIKEGKKNLVLVFDDKSEDAVSGGALSAIKSAFGV